MDPCDQRRTAAPATSTTSAMRRSSRADRSVIGEQLSWPSSRSALARITGRPIGPGRRPTPPSSAPPTAPPRCDGQCDGLFEAGAGGVEVADRHVGEAGEVGGESHHDRAEADRDRAVAEAVEPGRAPRTDRRVLTAPGAGLGGVGHERPERVVDRHQGRSRPDGSPSMSESHNARTACQTLGPRSLARRRTRSASSASSSCSNSRSSCCTAAADSVLNVRYRSALLQRRVDQRLDLDRARPVPSRSSSCTATL